MAELLIKNDPKLTNIYNNLIKNKKNSQSYMLVGNSKSKLNEYAILLSKILICPHSFEENCMKCNICKRIDNNNYPELKIINPENKVIKKEKIIDLTRKFQSQSIEGQNLVYIINDAESLNIAASNSILKFLEEPDSNVVAIFTTTNFDGVIKTITSRCQIIKLNNSKINEGIDFVIETSGLDKENVYRVIDFVKKIENNYPLAVAVLKEEFLNIFNNKDMLDKTLKVMLLFYKDALNYKINEKTQFFEKNEIKLVANNQTKDIISKKISFILENMDKIEYNVNILLFMNYLLIGIGDIKDDESSRN